jgi:hypothetical protein
MHSSKKFALRGNSATQIELFMLLKLFLLHKDLHVSLYNSGDAANKKQFRLPFYKMRSGHQDGQEIKENSFASNSFEDWNLFQNLFSFTCMMYMQLKIASSEF